MQQTSRSGALVVRRVLLWTIVLAACARPTSGEEVAPAKPLADLYRRAKMASVEVLSDGHLIGSAWFADPEGVLVTAAHMIESPSRTLEVQSPAVGRIDAELVAVDLGHDLALLRLKPRDGGYPVLTLAEKLPPPGDDVFLFGVPMFRHAVLLRGMAARDDTVFEYYAERFIEVSHVAATVQGGMSGGPWLNRQGEVVGLQSAVMSLNAVPVGIALMVPVDAIRTLLTNKRNAATPTMGAAVEELWQHGPDVLKRFPPRTEGLVVRAMRPDGPAARTGLKEWDLIVAADGQKVRFSGELLRIVRGKHPGETLKLSILGPDGTDSREVVVGLGTLEVGWPESDGTN